MTQLHLPWLELSILIPLAGAVAVGCVRDPKKARIWSLFHSGLALVFTVGAWQDFYWLRAPVASDPSDVLAQMLGRSLWVVDELVAPLLPLAALLYFLTILVTAPTKIRRFSFAWTLVSESILLAAFSCREPWVIIGMLAAGTVPPFVELRARNRPTRVFVAHMALFVGLLVLGWALAEWDGGRSTLSLLAIAALLAAVFVRSGMVPMHCWMTDLKAYFLVFTGKRRSGSISLQGRASEAFAVLTLTALILGGGVWPQPGVATRHDAATAILQHRPLPHTSEPISPKPAPLPE